ncbi:MAG: 4-hydroxy-tetrahydrodipicolinate reductase [Pseudomonadota bacterium]
MIDKLNIGIAGIAGRMGRQVMTSALAAGHRVTGGSERDVSHHVGDPIGSLIGDPGLTHPIVDDPVEAAHEADIWVDFTAPMVTLFDLAALAHSSVHGVIIGTTGFSDGELKQIEEFGERYAIVKAGNFSLGVNLLTALTRKVSARLGTDWDIEILETHHRHKVDAPSGTALMLGEAAAEGRGKPLDHLQRDPYLGTDAKRAPGDIGFSVRRSGGVIGDHEVTFGSETELVSLRHTALDRRVFAQGAIKAAEWAMTQEPGFYTMDDVLGV